MTAGDVFTIVWSLIQMTWALAYMGLGVFGVGYLLVALARGTTPAPIADNGLTTTWCAGCNQHHRTGTMAWTSAGLYRCRIHCYDPEETYTHVR